MNDSISIVKSYCRGKYTIKINDRNQKKFYVNGRIHRDNGPAFIFENKKHGYCHYQHYKNGKIHRDNGPAEIVISQNFIVHTWYKNGKIHRDNGPAVISYNNGAVVCEEHYKHGLRHGCTKNYISSTQAWYKKNNLHREDGPAYISKTEKYYYIDGKLHREDGPAFITRSVDLWYLNGKRHRIDGPAVIRKKPKTTVWDDKKDPCSIWWLYGDYYSKLGYVRARNKLINN